MSKLKPHTIFFILSIIFCFTSIISLYENEALVFNMNDTYYIISFTDFFKVFFLITFSIGLFYYLFEVFRISLNEKFKIYHTKLSAISLIILIIGIKIFDYLIKNNDSILTDYDTDKDLFVLITLLFFAQLQIVFIYIMMESTIKHVFRHTRTKQD